MDLSHHVPLPGPHRSVKVHGDGLRGGRVVQRARGDGRLGKRLLREGVGYVPGVGKVEENLSRLVLNTRVDHVHGEVVEGLRPNHAAARRPVTRYVRGVHAAVLVAAHVDHLLVFVVGGVGVHG